VGVALSPTRPHPGTVRLCSSKNRTNMDPKYFQCLNTWISIRSRKRVNNADSDRIDVRSLSQVNNGIGRTGLGLLLLHRETGLLSPPGSMSAGQDRTLQTIGLDQPALRLRHKTSGAPPTAPAVNVIRDGRRLMAHHSGHRGGVYVGITGAGTRQRLWKWMLDCDGPARVRRRLGACGWPARR